MNSEYENVSKNVRGEITVDTGYSGIGYSGKPHIVAKCAGIESRVPFMK